MGNDRTIYLQAFIKIPTQYGGHIAIIRTCGEHENFNRDAYCPECGKEIKVQEITEENIMWADGLIGNENFWDHIEGETMYLFSNIQDCGIDTEEDSVSMVNNQIISDKIRLFETVHSEDIRLLERKLNISVKVEFGFLYKVG